MIENYEIFNAIPYATTRLKYTSLFQDNSSSFRKSKMIKKIFSHQEASLTEKINILGKLILVQDITI